MSAGLRKWPTGMFAAWYPIKDGRIGDMLAGAAAIGGLPKTVRAEFCALPRDGVAMVGGGLLIANAPWKLDEKLEALCRELAPLLGDGRATWTVKALSPPP